MFDIKSKFALGAVVVAVVAAAPASAQVSGIATADPAFAIAASQARATAYQQISTTYAAQQQSITARRQEEQTLLRQLDTDGNSEVDDAELQAAQASNNPVLGQIQAKRNEINTLSQPIARAQLYALEQILTQYAAAQQQVVSQRQISVILTPEAFVYAPDSADVTQYITTQLNTQVPAVSTAVPEGWQPQRQTMQLHQRIQEILVAAAIQQQRAQQQGQQPATEQPQGR